MNRLRTLAASARPLAEVLIDALRSSSNLSRLRATLPDEEHSGPDQFSLRLEDEINERPDSNAIRGLHPEDAAAAALLGQAFEQSRETLAHLRDADTAAIIEVSHADLVEPVARLLRNHLLGPETPVVNGDSIDRQTSTAPIGAVLIFKRTDEAKPRKALTSGTEFAAAVQLRCSIIGIAADPQQLPRELFSLAEHRIIVPPLDGAAIAAVIEAVTGRHPGAIDEYLARRVTLEMLSIAVRADLGAKRSMARLRRLADAQARDQEIDGPLLSEMHGLGPAKQFGLDLVADLRSYIAGKLPWSACPKGLLLSGPPGTGKTSYARGYPVRPGPLFILSRPAIQSGKATRMDILAM